MSFGHFKIKPQEATKMLYIVKNNKGKVIMPNKVFELFQCHLNYRDPSGQSVQVDHDDDLSFKKAMAEAGYSVEEYKPNHE